MGAGAIDLPEGFELDQEEVALPEGFVLDDAVASVTAKRQGVGRGGAIHAATEGVLDTAVGKGLVGLGGGLVRAGIGAIQGLNDLTGDRLGIRDAAKAAVEESRGIEDKLGGIGKITGMVGEYGPYAALPAGGATIATRTALGAVAGGAQGAATAEGAEDISREKSIAQGALTGALVVPGVELAGKGLKAASKGAASTGRDAIAGAGARSGEVLAERSTALKVDASAKYRAAREAGAIIKKNRVNDLVDEMDSALKQSGITNPDLHKDTLSVMKQVRDAAGRDMSLEEADQYRQLLGEVIARNSKGGMNDDARRAAILVEKLDDFVEGIGRSDLRNGKPEAAKLWQEARQDWGKWRRFDAVAQIVQRADGDAKKLRNGLTKFLANPKNTRGMNAGEKAGLQRAAQEKGFDKALSWVGKFGFGNNLSTWGGGVGALAVNPALAAVPAVGTLAKAAEKYAVRGRADQALKLLEAR